MRCRIDVQEQNLVLGQALSVCISKHPCGSGEAQYRDNMVNNSTLQLVPVEEVQFRPLIYLPVVQEVVESLYISSGELVYAAVAFAEMLSGKMPHLRVACSVNVFRCRYSVRI